MEADRAATVLVVDDEPANLGVLFEHLRHAGLKTLVAQNGRAALQILDRFQPDIVLLDIMLPDIDGFELCRQLRERDKGHDIPVIFLSALTDTDIKIRALEMAAVDYITKPFQPQEIIARVKRHLLIRDLQSQLRERNALLQREITERKEAEKERLRLERELRQAQKADSLGRMAASIAHHFNNMFMAVIGNLELALDDLPHDSDAAESIFKAMKASCRAARISRLMLAYLGQTDGKGEPLDLAEAVEEALDLLGDLLPVNVRLETELSLPGPVILSDAAHINQILRNLLMNAVEAIGDRMGEITLAARVISATEIRKSMFFPADWEPRAEDYACLSASDTGCGLDPATVEKIFDPFFSSKLPGRGLGLPVVLGLARAHEGAITVESQLEQGTTFRVLFPISEQKELPVRKGPISCRTGNGGMVLLVEDEPMVRDIAQIMLKRLGYEVITACNGEKAVEIFREKKDALLFVLLDLTMPRMNGWDALAELRALRPDIPVVLASGFDEAHAMQSGQSEHPQAFLHKPYQKTDLLAAIETALKKAGQ